MKPIPVLAFNAVSAGGRDMESLEDAVFNGYSGLALSKNILSGTTCPVGELSYDLPLLEPALKTFDSRAARILASAFEPVAGVVEVLSARWSPSRIGVVVGTSASGNFDLEKAFLLDGAAEYSYHERQSFGALAAMLRALARVQGPAMTVSTACSSGANAIVTAACWIQSGACDAVVAASVDALCGTTYHGFNGLGVMDSAVCRPFDKDRKGLNLGEGSGIVVLSRELPNRENSMPKLALAGWGTASQAYHMTAPDPDGNGAVRTMMAALDMAGIGPDRIGYINLHGTATPLNDVAEARGVAKVFGAGTHASSTKGITGHALGAAAGIEAAITLAALRAERLPINANLVELDPDVEIPVLTKTVDAPGIEYAMSNSFAFGGNDATLIFTVLR